MKKMTTLGTALLFSFLTATAMASPSGNGADGYHKLQALQAQQAGQLLSTTASTDQ